MQRDDDYTDVYLLSDSDRSTDKISSYLAVAPSDGYYDVIAASNVDIEIDGAMIQTDSLGNACVYLRRGLNYIDIMSSDATISVCSSIETANIIKLNVDDASLEGSAKANRNENNSIKYIDGITSSSGSATYTINAPNTDTYKLTIMYSNNEENGVHDYNVDVVEEFITISVNGNEQELYCRNTSSWDTFTTVTTNIELNKGENVITLYNDGSVRFNDGETSAPHIALLTVNETYKK